ncbi:MAG: hypothetical protein QNJ63_24955 [Calothrix sp. MO_192.B10]|nr:hypothetical protein [Calothrix sp. MO_192.B10]
MLTHHRKLVSLSLVSVDLPVWSVVETAATLYQKDRDRFHLLLTAPPQQNNSWNISFAAPQPLGTDKIHGPTGPRILWLEISPYRVIMTMQGNSQLSYRHFWEKGVYGVTRYWLPNESLQPQQPIRLRNFTNVLELIGYSVPEHLRVEYELWTGKMQLGRYVLNLEIKH